jgi:hypothetical protein
MTERELVQIEARVRAASEPPWEAVLLNDFTDRTSIEGPEFVSDQPLPNPETEQESYQHVQRQIHMDALFIAAARRDVPTLVAEVRRLRKALAYLRGSADDRERLIQAIDVTLNGVAA